MLDDTTQVADRQLLDRVARGEADALRTLYRRHSNTVYALAYGILVHPGDAEEVVAETFSHASQARRAHHDSRGGCMINKLLGLAVTLALPTLMAAQTPQIPNEHSQGPAHRATKRLRLRARHRPLLHIALQRDNPDGALSNREGRGPHDRR